MSTRAGGRNKENGTLENCLCLNSLALLKNWPEGFETTLSWENGHSIRAHLYEGVFWLGYSISDESIIQAVHLSRISNGFGGNPRVYFLCPSCEKRVQMLYMSEKRFQCRTCAKVNYRSQQISHGLNSTIWRMDSILQKGFGIDTSELSPRDMHALMPDKPKGMHNKTYNHRINRLRQVQNKYALQYIVELCHMLAALRKIAEQ